jgi:hypothetical protein
MFALLAAAASLIKPVASSAATGIMAGLSGADKKDPERIAAAQAALTKALAGDASQILYMQQQAGQVVGYGSATAVGKEAFRRALAEYDRQRGTHYNSQSAAATSTASPAQAVIAQTQAAVRTDLANGAQQLLTGTVNSITGAISPNAGPSVPLTQNQLSWIYVGAAALVLIAIPLLFHKGHA